MLRIILCICSTLSIPGIILSMGSANERRRYYVTPSLIGWTHTQNDPCIQMRLYWNVFVSTCLFIWNNFHSWSCMSCGIIYTPHETIHRKWYWTTIHNFKISTGYHKRDVTSVYFFFLGGGGGGGNNLTIWFSSVINPTNFAQGFCFIVFSCG